MDVTGGMAEKLRWAREAARAGAHVLVCRVGTPHFGAAVRGEVHAAYEATGRLPEGWVGTHVPPPTR